ncbi:MAG: site-specific DNA-methyltransferase [Treponema sp.]|jgi:DNA modification methylase|nr:site-specific DNA-methyltransferase [Treponema sp.]
MAINRLILGDNLEILKGLEAESVDLIYLDPPFFSNRNYEVIWGDAGEVRSFQDRWAGGIDHYIAWLKERVEEMYRILKPTGSIFLHCDWHADAYIRVDILDRIFGMNNFRNHIIWKRTNAKNNITQRMGIIIDTIFFYSKSDAFKMNLIRGDYSPEQMSRYKQEDENGLYRCDDLTAPGKSRQFIWRGVHSGANRSWRFTEEALEELVQKDLITYQKDGRPRKDGLKKYLSETEGALIGNLWDDIDRVGNTSNERIGYPTQKPEVLLERIIKCASNEGDIVLDPFMGGGTTIAVADRLNRQWIGIDQSAMAVKVTELRLQKQADLFSSPYTVQLHKYDYDTLRYKDAFQFEAWIVQQFGGTPNAKQRGDMGLDGKTGDGTPIQVKRSDNIGRNVIDNFKSAVERFDKNLFEKNIAAKKSIGYIIAFSFGKGAIEEVARLKNKEDRIIKLVTVEEIIPIATKPVIGVHINELEKDLKGNRKIELVATGQSAAGIEFYSWDFVYDKEKGFSPSIIIDKDGKQIISLKTGTHTIAVKVVDNDGLENMEIITLKINGVVEQID